MKGDSYDYLFVNSTSCPDPLAATQPRRDTCPQQVLLPTKGSGSSSFTPPFGLGIGAFIAIIVSSVICIAVAALVVVLLKRRKPPTLAESKTVRDGNAVIKLKTFSTNERV